jgi:hypothetical protein
MKLSLYFIFTGMRLATLLLLFLILAFPGKAQEMLGMATGSAAGIHSSLLNPAGMMNSRFYADIQVFGGSGFEDNNYLYIPADQYSFHDLLNKQGQLYTEENPSPDKYTIYDWYNESDKEVYSASHIMSPGFMISGEKHSFAFQAQERNILSVHKLPYHVAKFILEGLSYVPQQDIKYTAAEFQVSEVNWAELDFSYAARVYHNMFNQLSVGITAKRMGGVAGFNLLNRETIYTALSHDTLIIRPMDMDVGLSVPIDHQTNESTLSNNLFRGHGWGWDIGLYYQKNLVKEPRSKRMISSLCGQDYLDYRFKIGIAVLDLGSIHFDREAELLKFTQVSTFWPGIDTTDYKNIDDAVTDLSLRFYYDSTAAIAATSFSIPLPTMLSFQFDYNFGKGFYLNSVLMYNLQLQPDMPYRPAQLAIIPRFDSRNIGVSMPVSLYDFRKVRLGLCLRLFIFTLGTEMLGPYVGGQDFTGLDIYGSVRISLNKGYCKNKGKVRHCGNAEFQKYLRKNP